MNLGTASVGDSVTASFLGATLQSATRNGGNATLNSVAFAGTAANDFVVAADAGSMLSGGDGSDMLIGGSGIDTLNGDAGNDSLSGNAGFDFLNGGIGDDLLLGGTGDDTLNGGDGNDTIYAGDGSDIANGGSGADIINLASNTIENQWTEGSAAGDADGTVKAPTFTYIADGQLDAVQIAVGESTVSAYDKVTGFNAVAGATADRLDLASITVAPAGNITGTAAGNVQSASVTATGIITFDDAAPFATAITVGTGAGQLSLANVLDYLSANIANNLTVAFGYDVNGNGVTTDAGVDSTFVFQGGTSDTVVELVGTVGITALGGAAAANTIWLF